MYKIRARVQECPTLFPQEKLIANGGGNVAEVLELQRSPYIYVVMVFMTGITRPRHFWDGGIVTMFAAERLRPLDGIVGTISPVLS
jgi:hypothetical protein